MTPYWRKDGCTIYRGDCLDFLAAQEPASVALVLVDPPYCNVKMDLAWDRQWKTDAEYLAWIGRLCEGWQRVLATNGSLYCFASPDMAARVECVVRERFNVLNRIRWIKPDGWHRKQDENALRCYLSPWEEVVFAEHPGSDNAAVNGSGYASACDNLRGFVFESLRSYLDGERLRADISFEQVRKAVGCAPGSGLPSHWFTKSQWELPTEGSYRKLQAYFNAHGRYPAPPFAEYHRMESSCLKFHSGTHEYLRADYEHLRADYEYLRRPFFAPRTDEALDTWRYPVVAPYPGKHPCEKPAALLQNVIRTSSRPGDLVLDCCMGGGSTGHAALRLGRQFVGCDIDEHWVGYTRKRLERALAQPALPFEDPPRREKPAPQPALLEVP